MSAITDTLSAPWAILPEKLHEIHAVVDAHLAHRQIDIGAVEAKLGRPLENKPQGYQVVDGVAVVPIEGVIARRMNMMSEISGGASSELVARDVSAALSDPGVHSIVLAIDSPGGTVSGTDRLSGVILGARGKKPIVAWTAGTMASAAYWIGSAADAIVLGDANATLGSIGVVAKHVDISRAQEAAGVKTTEIVAGKYKRAASEYAALSEEGRAHLQEQVDTYYANFVSAVAAHRGVSIEQVLSNMADGRIFIGKQAIDAGLADSTASLDVLIADLNNRAADRRLQSLRSPAMDITKDRIVAEFPDIAAALKADGAAAERARIQEIERVTAKARGHDELIAKMKFDGASNAGEVAAAVLLAEGDLQAQRLAQIRADAPAPMPQDPSPTIEQAAGSAKLPADAPIEERAKHDWDADAQVRKEFGGRFEAYVAFRRADEDGRARIFKQGA